MLTQNTSWRNVESALAGLWTTGLIDLHAMGSAPLDRLAGAVRPSGYFNRKAARLQGMATYIENQHDGSVGVFLRRSPKKLRAELLGLQGVGPETADSILLYAAQVPIFVIDAYTRRIMGRLGMVDTTAEYEALQAEFESALPVEHELYNEYHALLVKLATTSCKTTPDCPSCCLKNCCDYFANEYVEPAG
jgi:endonuclease-3 related protein